MICFKRFIKRYREKEGVLSLMAASLSRALKIRRAPFSTPHFSILPFSTSQTAAAAASHPQVKEGGRWSKLLLFIPGAITFGLGTWQIFRRQDKIEMLEYRRKRLEMEPMMLNRMATSDGDLNPMEFRKVVCEGVFDEDKSIYVGPRSRSISGVTENGYFIITPLIPTTSEPGSVQVPVLVNRGWVPRVWRNKPLGDSQGVGKPSNSKTADAQQDERSGWWKFWSKKPPVKEPIISPVQVIGVIRGSEKPSIFVPANDPTSAQWFYVDVPMIARCCGLPENTIYIEDINEDINAAYPYPVPKDGNALIRHSVMPQDHLNYTITWYSLSAAVTFMAIKRIRPKKIQR